ncbi:MAG: CsgG/HfaB family protein, partial [Parvularculaceae bacterium]|nr:CsgG/HfaB family protein [Parvularculaceae bacterium]
MKLKMLLALGAGLAVASAPAFAAKGVDNQRGSFKNEDVPKCAKSLGTITLTDGEGRGWLAYQLGAPSTLLKVMISRSGCFKLLDRGAGLAALQQEQALAAAGKLQRKSNVGGGQVKAADYVLVADIGAANSNASGSAVGGVAGAVIGGRVGGLIGGIKSKRAEAQTVLTLMNVRTSEIEATAEGSASKKDIAFGAGAGYGWAGVAGGGYDNTEIGKVVTWAFIDAYRSIVSDLGGLPADASAAAPKESFIVSAKSVDIKRSPSASSKTVRSLEKGDTVYPTGGKEDMWWEVEDENGNAG